MVQAANEVAAEANEEEGKIKITLDELDFFNLFI